MLIAFILSFAISPVAFADGASRQSVVAASEETSVKPTEAELEILRKQIRTQYNVAYADADDADKCNALALRLFETARLPEARKDLAQRYGLLMEAHDLALRGRSLRLAFRVIIRLGSWYRPLDQHGMRVHAVVEMGGEGPTRQERKFFARQALNLAGVCLARKSVDECSRVLKAIAWTVENLNNKELTKRHNDAKQQLEEFESRLAALDAFRAHESYLSGLMTLKEQPENQQANLNVGWYLTFFRGDFQSGLPLLALAPQSPAADCVKRDLACSGDPLERLAVGKVWRDWGLTRKNSRIQEGALKRARHWLELALPGLLGRPQEQCEELLGELRGDLGGEPEPVIGRRRIVHATARSRRGLTVRQKGALDRGIAWLIEHQSADGSWSARDFGDGCECGGRGRSEYSVGVTSLALIALLESGGLAGDTPCREPITRGLRWLQDQQDPETGLIGEREVHEFLYNHAIAVQALAKGFAQEANWSLDTSCKAGARYIQNAGNRYGGWSYDVPPMGRNDSSLTTWMIAALAAARDIGIKVDARALENGLAWLDEVSDPLTGRCGYGSFGSLASRHSDNLDYPRVGDESLTAAALHSRWLLGLNARTKLVVDRGCSLLARRIPMWKKGGKTHMVLFWYYGTEALFGMREQQSRAWNPWHVAVNRALLASQVRKGHAAGSWNPDGPWGYAGGRVYSTSLAILCLTKPKS